MNYSTRSLNSIDHKNDWITLGILENTANELGCVFSYEKQHRDKVFFDYCDECVAEIDNPENKFNPVWRVVTYRNGFEYHDSGFLETSYENFKNKVLQAMQGVKQRKRDRLKKEIEEESAEPLL